MPVKYFIAKDKYIHRVTSFNGYGEPDTSKREDIKKVKMDRYILTYMKFLGFDGVSNKTEARKKAPFTVEFLEAQYKTLYKKEDIELDEDILFKSLREVGRIQKLQTQPK